MVGGVEAFRASSSRLLPFATGGGGLVVGTSDAGRSVDVCFFSTVRPLSSSMTLVKSLTSALNFSNSLSCCWAFPCSVPPSFRSVFFTPFSEGGGLYRFRFRVSPSRSNPIGWKGEVIDPFAFPPPPGLWGWFSGEFPTAVGWEAWVRVGPSPPLAVSRVFRPAPSLTV